MTTLGKRSQHIPGAVFRNGGSHAKKAWMWAERSFGSLKCSRGTRSGCSVEVLPADVVFADVVIISLFVTNGLKWPLRPVIDIRQYGFTLTTSKSKICFPVPKPAEAGERPYERIPEKCTIGQ